MAARRRTGANPSEAKVGSAKIMTEESQSNGEDEMSFEDKLDYIDREIRKLHVFCVNSGYSAAQIERFVEPFSQSVKTVNRQRWKRRGVYLAVFIAVAAALFYIDPVYKFTAAVTRKGAIALLPIWDWTQVYDYSCLVDNPLYTGNQLKSEECQSCEGSLDIDRVKNLHQGVFATRYLDNQKPVIVEDGMRDWPNLNQYNLATLHKIYQENADLRGRSSCKYSSNVRGQFKDHRMLLRGAANGEVDNFYAHWENCFAEAAKAFRHHYKRPYFLPSVVELQVINHVIVSSNFTAKIRKLVPMHLDLVILAQVKGSMEVTVIPREPCDAVCEKMTTTLKEGEILVGTDFLWETEYRPVAEGESITFGLGGAFD